ncbi:MAG: glycosyltransferase [Candidatus Azobacteroides sp.]|nr:glycosyltransferase [Candidatus Azobacteroides sp.]
MRHPTPIALFVYNRLSHLKRTIACLQKNILAAESDLYIFSDGAKNEKDREKVKEVRTFIHSVTGFKNITIIEKDKNHGLAASVIAGVSFLVEKYGKVIVMEDDLESSPYMLSYFNDALNFYENNEKVMHIGGYMYPIDLSELPETFFFRVATSWGWATWQRAWEHFEPDIEKLNEQFNPRKISDFSIDCSENFWKQFQHFRKGKNNSWAIRWYASIFLHGGVCLHPSVSMTNNIGNDASGTHSDATDMYQTPLSTKRITGFSDNIEENKEAYQKIKHFYRTRKGSLWKRGIRFLRKWKNKLSF